MAEAPDRLVQETDPREAIGEVLRAIRRNAVRVAFTTAVFLLLGLFLTMLWPNKYQSATSFALRDWQIVADSTLIDDLGDIPLPRKVKALENELRSRKRIDKVMNELQWVEWLDTAGKEADRRTLVDKLGKNLEVEIIPDVTGTQNVRISFRWTTPRKAADFVNRLRDTWIQLTIEGYRKSLEENKQRLEAVLVDRSADYQAALAAKRVYETENHVPALLSSEVNNELKGELLLKKQVAEADLETAQSEISRLSDQLKQIPAEITAPKPPDTEEQAEAQLKLQQAEATLEATKDPVSGYTELHWKRVKAQKEYDAAVAALVAAGGSVGEDRVQTQVNPAYFDVATKFEAAEAKAAEVRALLSSIQKGLDEAQANLDQLPVVTEELAQHETDVTVAEELVSKARNDVQPLRDKVLQFRAANFATDSGGFDLSNTPFEILEIGVEPAHAVLPISAIIMAVSLMVGLGLGALGPVLAEMTRSSFGTVKEVSRTLGVPVIGAVDLILTARDIRARRVQRALSYATMALVLVSLATALYIYQAHPEALPTALRRTLRDVRMALT